MTERTILITGATDGLGRRLAERLAAEGAHVIVHGRDPGRVRRVREAIGRQTDAVLADLADLHQVDRLAGEVLRRCPRLDVLVNNAGVGSGPPGAARELSADGVELRFAVNYLAGYHLTRRLIPLLTASAPAKVVNVSSAGQRAIDFADPMLERGYDGMRAYMQSKLAQIMFTFDLAAELRDAGVAVNALHPATYMDTTMVRESGVSSVSTVEDGAQATLRLINAADVTGRYYNTTREARAGSQAYDPQARRRLRELSDRLIARALEGGPADQGHG